MKDCTKRRAWQRYTVAVGAVAAMAALRWVIQPVTGTSSPLSTFYFAVIAASWWGGLGPGLLSIALSVAVADLLFIGLPDKFSALPMHQWLLVSTFVVVNVTVCFMMEALHRARRNADAHAQEIREKHESLRQAEAQIEHIVESVRDFAIIAMDADGYIVRWNRGAESIFGYSKEEVCGRAGEILFTPEDRAAGIPERELKEAREKGLGEDERWHLHKDGTRFFGTGSVSPVHNDAGKLLGFTKVLRDSTTQWNALRALRESEESFRAVFETVSIGMVQLDPQTGRFLRVNHCFCEITGYSEQELSVMSFRDLTVPDEREASQNDFQRMVRGETEHYLVDKHYVRKNGRVIWVHVGAVLVRDDAGRPRYVVKMVQDISERKHAELAVAEAEERFRMAAEIAGIGAWEVNHETGELHWSPRLKEIFGLGPDAKIQREAALQMVHPDDRAELMARVRTAMDASGPRTFFSEHRIVRPDGMMRWLQSGGLILFAGEGTGRRPIRAIGAARDVTERKEAEQRLRRREEAILALATTQSETLEKRLWQITEAAARALDADRVGVWLYTADRSGIQCEDLYQRQTGSHKPGGTCLVAQQYPRYFAALGRGAPIVAHDARTHGDTAEFRENYLEPLGISSMLDVPIWVAGRLAGVVCFEHTGAPRRWSLDDQEFAASLATTVALAMEAEQRRRAEEARAEAEERLRLAAKAGGMGTFDTNFKTRKTHWSPEMRVIFGLPADMEVALEKLPLFVHPDDRERVADEISRALSPDGPGNLESVQRVLHADGSVRWIRISGRTFFEDSNTPRHAARILGVALDITALKEAEEAARESGERFRTLADNISQLVWMADENGRTFWYNRRWLDYTGTNPEELQGWGWLKIIDPDHVERVANQFRQHIESGEAWEDTYPVRGQDGSYRWFLSQAVPIRDQMGKVVRWFGTSTDVTEQRKGEETLREADRRKSEFLAMLGHELRNPLSAIRNALALCELDRESFEWAKGVVDRQSEQLARLVEDLLDVSRIARGKVILRRKPVEVCSVVSHAVEAARPLIAQRGHELTVHCPTYEMWIDADPGRVEQIVGNLLTNAAKYTEPGGKIWVTVSPSCPVIRPRETKSGPGEGQELEASETEASQEITITVRDTGIGIPPEKLPQMFEIFAQAERSLDRSDGGLGLGLAIVKMLTEMHGGRVVAWSAGPGKGSTFSIHLPATIAPAPVADTIAGKAERSAATEMPTAPSPKPEAPCGAGQRVLVVDDNADAANALGRILRRSGCELEIALDGPSALESARRFHPTAVLLDIGLPGMDGYEVAKHLRAEEGEVHALLVAVTGYGQEEDFRRSREAGFDRHMVKPINISEIKQLLAAGSPTR